VSRVLVRGCEAVVTMDDAGTELTGGSVLAVDGVITWAGTGEPPGGTAGAYVIDGRGTVALPGLVNTHHHLYQLLTRVQAQQADLFGWLTHLYPLWAGTTEDLVRDAARAGLAELALSGCTTAADHHYLFPQDAGDCFAATIEAAGEVGLRFAPTRGSMDRGVSDGGLPPDEVVETTEAALAATAAAVDAWHDPAPGSMVRVAVAPCSPFSVSGDLMREAADLAADKGVRLHTHLSETADDVKVCRETYGCGPVELLERLGWLHDRTWLAHGVHLDDGEITALARAGTGVAHCPSSNMRLGSGLARVPELLTAGVKVGLGVDGSASNDAGDLLAEARQAMFTARARLGPAAMDARTALRLATRGGAEALGRSDLGVIEPGRRADLVLFRVDTLPFAGTAPDPVAALAFCAPQRAWQVLVEGRIVVAGGRLATLDEEEVAKRAAQASAELLEGLT
jgi:cytosine/adenosine deaminase-related metal-dependent hydrolase